jgi:hypothetical protein
MATSSIQQTTITLLAVNILMASCKVTSEYFQVYKVKPENGTLSDNKLIFEDNYCVVQYDLWSNEGNIGFRIYNKTDHDITLDLTKTFFVINDWSREYYTGKASSISETNSLNVNQSIHDFKYFNYEYKITGIDSSNMKSSAISTIQRKEITIPSKTYVVIFEYTITNSRYIICHLPKYPINGSTEKAYFDKKDSPINFYNIITYRHNSETMRMENKFHVVELANHTKHDMLVRVDTSVCGRTLEVPEWRFKEASPDKFYFRYTK